jgi:hypothetical protein
LSEKVYFNGVIPRRGTSGALYRQSALAGLSAGHAVLFPVNLFRFYPALKAGSGALLALKPRQVRKEAAVRESFKRCCQGAWLERRTYTGLKILSKSGGMALLIQFRV